MAKSTALDTVRRFQSEVAAVREAPEPAGTRIAVHALTALLVVSIGFLSVSRVDRVVTSSYGRIVAPRPPTVFQALDDSIVKSIDVREGDRVVKGQTLATLDPTFAGADVTQLAQQAASFNAQLARAEAELAGRAPKFVEGDERQKYYNDAQRVLFNQRADLYRSQLNSYDQKIAQITATIQKLEGDEGRYKERKKIAEQVEGMRSTLVEKGAGTLLNLYSSQDQRIELARTIEFTHNSLVEAQHQLSSQKADRDAFMQQWKTDLSKDLVTARNGLDQANAQLEKARRKQDLVRIVAPEDSIILTIAKLSVGSVLKGGDPFVTAVPLKESLEAEVRMSARDVGFMRAGDRASLKIDAFNYVEHGMAEGTVKWISEGAFSTADDTNQPVDPYYKARISIDATHFVNVPDNFRFIPGMTLTADVHVGRRTLGAYLFESVFKGAGEAMREP